jgi:hypothetical protein
MVISLVPSPRGVELCVEKVVDPRLFRSTPYVLVIITERDRDGMACINVARLLYSYIPSIRNSIA